MEIAELFTLWMILGPFSTFWILLLGPEFVSVGMCRRGGVCVCVKLEILFILAEHIIYMHDWSGCVCGGGGLCV